MLEADFGMFVHPRPRVTTLNVLAVTAGFCASSSINSPVSLFVLSTASIEGPSEPESPHSCSFVFMQTLLTPLPFCLLLVLGVSCAPPG